MAYSASETIRVMRMMRGRAGHWREGGFGTDVILALCAPDVSDQEPPDRVERPFEEISQLGLEAFNVMVAMCAGMVWW